MKITNKYGLPQPFVSAVEREYTYKDKQYSVTALLKGTCQAILERRHDDEIEQDVADMIWMIFGTSVHAILENAQETIDQLKENKLVIDLPNGYKVSGIFDLYDDKDKEVTDYKTGSVNKVLFNDWEDYRLQTLFYCWMLRQIGFMAYKGKIVMMLKDHSKMKAKTQAGYPQSPVHIESWTFTDKDFEWLEQFLDEKFSEIKEYESLSDEELPSCTPKERWHKEDKYAVMKEGRKSAVRVLNSQEEAEEYITKHNLDKKHYIEKRDGSDTRCDEYCTVNKWCPFYQAKVGMSNDNE